MSNNLTLRPASGLKGNPCSWTFSGNQFANCFSMEFDLEYETGKQLQVTTIKITESKENKSIHRLYLSGSTGTGGQLPTPLH